MNYRFKTHRPFNQRGENFPKGVIRIRRTSLTISADVMEQFQKHRRAVLDETERVPLTFNVDKRSKAVQLVDDGQGYVLQIRGSGAGYLNTTRLGNFGLPIADYKLVDDKNLIFAIAK